MHKLEYNLQTVKKGYIIKVSIYKDIIQINEMLFLKLYSVQMVLDPTVL